MNSQMVYELWKELLKPWYNPVPKAAELYVMGDDTMFDSIPQGRGIWGYPKELIKELDGDGAEMAKRCLRTYAKFGYGGMMGGSVKIAFLHKIGFTLADILNYGFDKSPAFYNSSYIGLSREIMQEMPDEAEKLITPQYLRSVINGIDKKTDLAFHIAAQLLIEGRGDTKGLADELYKYVTSTHYDTAAKLLRYIYKLDPRFEQHFITLMKDPGNMRAVWNDNANGFMDIVKELDLYNNYLFTAVIDCLDSEEADAAAHEIAASPDELLPLMTRMMICMDKDKTTKGILERMAEMLSGKRRDTEKLPENFSDNVNANNVYYVCKMAYPLALALKNGRGQDILAEFERSYSKMLFTMGEEFVFPDEVTQKSNVNRGLIFAKLLEESPDNTARQLTFADRRGVLRWEPLTAFSLLYDYSQKARNIIYTFIKAAEYHCNTLHCTKACQIMAEFCRQRRKLGHSYADSIRLLMRDCLGVELYFNCAVLVGSGEIYYYNTSGGGFDCLPEIMADNMQAAIDFYDRIKDNARASAYWAEMLYKKACCRDIDLLMSLMKSKSKSVRKIAADVIAAGEEDFRAPLEELLPKLKGDALVQAQGIIKKWDNNKKYGKDFTFTTNALAEDYAAENINPAAVKKTAFIPEEYFADVRFADLDGRASKELVRYIIGEYLLLDEPYRITVCDKLAAKLYAPDLQACIENIYRDWLQKGADNKTKMIMVPYCVYASDTQILALKKQLTTWADNQRGALGAFVIKAVAVNGGSTALMMVNDISSKFPNNQIKKAAKAAFSYAAKALELPEDVLADRIVPTLGLDKNGEKILDFGARTFTLSLMPDFTLSIHDNAKDKDIKSLPKAAAGDDETKAEEAKKYVSELKKQLKAVSAAQKNRLEAVFRNGRTWTCEAWNALFVDNPVMHRFAGTLIWGTYKDGALQNTFRYCDDGSFCDENDDTFELPEDAQISLAHPVEMSEESISAWLEQLSDYEIVQPFAQISAKIIRLTDKDVDDKQYIIKYKNRTFTVSSMNNAAKKYNLIRSSVEDGGGFSGYHIQDRTLGIGIKFGFEDMYMGKDFSESVELSNVYLYRLPEEDEVPDSYSEYDAIPPAEVSVRFVSCCLDLLEGILD